MPETESIWIESHKGINGTYWAQFAARVLLHPFETLAKFRWGWSSSSLLEEGLDRQIQFLETQHVQESHPGIALETCPRKLAVRYIHSLESSEIKIVLIGNVTAETEIKAEERALEYWEEITSSFPYDYALRPLRNKMDFISALRQDVIRNIHEKDEAVEIRRYVNELRGKSESILFPGQWRWTTVANEQIWRVLSGCSKPVMLQVTIQPVALREEERSWMIAQENKASSIAKDEKEDQLIRKYAEYASRVFMEQAKSYRNLYHVQVHVISTGGVPGYLIRAIGAAFTHRDDRPVPLPGYQIVEAGSEIRDSMSINSMPWDPCNDYNAYNRLVYLMNVEEAHVAFRWPYPSAGGIPGVNFQYEE